METVYVEVFGKKYPFRGEDPEKIRQYAEYLNDLLVDISSKYGLVNYQESMVMICMLITENYFTIKEQKEVLENKIVNLNEIMNDLIQES